jgi:Mor family transcriptional regulator
MKNEPVDKILQELDKIRQFLLKFRDTGKIPDIERDIVSGKLRNIYEFIQLIQLEEADNVDLQEEPVIVKATEKISSVIAEDKSVTIEFSDDLPGKQIETEVAELLSEPVITAQNIEEAVIQPQSKQNIVVKKEILAEKFQSQSFLNEALAHFQDVADLSKKLQNQPLKDIFSAINLNDKFLFIKELFANDSALYQSTVEKVNNAGNFNDAVRYLDGNFAWDFNDQMVQKFLELVRRRFM